MKLFHVLFPTLVSAAAAQTIPAGIALGACEDFALMAGTAATCAGAPSCEILGNIGVSPGTSITGNFDAATVDATGCAADGLAALTSGFIKSGNVGKLMDTGEMGGVTFTSGVYTIGTALTIALANPTVYLDAQDDENAVFIFVAGTTLTTCADSNIVLLNGAKADRVYWVLGTALTMGAGSSLKGSVLAGTAINIGTNGDICGRAIAQTAIACETHCTIGFSDCWPQAPTEAICLYNSDFKEGTKIIDSPGKYKLCEGIVFDPHTDIFSEPSPAEAYDPNVDIFDPNAFGLGFFAALAITASNVELYLNGYSIEQSAGHALLQRFFAVIELNDSPFIANAGPAQFVGEGSTFQAASNVLIQGPGMIGRSAHHGIHGNDNVNVVIRDVTFEDFEVAAVSLNNADNAIITGNRITRNRHDVPVLGSFSAARQIRQYGKVLKENQFSMDIKGVTITAADVYDSLVSYINNVYTDVVQNGGFINGIAHPNEHYLFDNPKRVIDGPCYAFVVHGKGPAVGGFGFAQAAAEAMSSNISITNNVIENIKCWTNEVPAAVVGGVVQTDARGAVLQFVKTTDPGGFLAINSDGTYRRNPVADMQMMTAHAIQRDELTSSPALQTIVNTISPTLVAWAQSVDAVFNPEYRCNGDSMHHTVKGMVMIRVDDTEGFEVDGNTINNVQNLSNLPFQECSSYQTGVEDAEVQQVGNIRIISASAVTGYNGSKSSSIVSNTIINAGSELGTDVIGIDIQGESDSIHIDFNNVDLATDAGTSPDDQFIALRVRKFVESSAPQTIDVGSSNEFAQEVQILNRRLGDKSRRTKLLEAHKHANQNMGNEWNLGGCPFAKNFTV